MDAKHLHMEIVNRSSEAVEAYARCVAVMEDFGALPGGAADHPGDKPSYDLVMALGSEIKGMIRDHAREEHGVDFDGNTLTESLYCTFVGHISTEALGDLFYASTYARCQS